MMVQKRDVLRTKGWVVPHAKGRYAGPIQQKSYTDYFPNGIGNTPELDDAMNNESSPSKHKGKATNAEVLLPEMNYNANSDAFLTETSSIRSHRWETMGNGGVRRRLQEMAEWMVGPSRNKLAWGEELILGITGSDVDAFAGSAIPLKQSAAWVNCIAPGYDFSDGQVIEAFRILHYDAKTQNYICRSSTPMSADFSAPLHCLPLFVVPAIMLTGQKEITWTLLPGQREYAMGGMDYTEPLGFGDYIVIHSQFTGTTDDPISYPLRAVHAEKGLYDLVMNGTEWRRHHCNAIGFKIDRTTIVQPSKGNFLSKATRTTEFGYGEFLSLAIGVGRLHDVMHIASETAIPVDPDKPEWIPTHLDNRGAKRVELRTPPPSGGKSDIVRCRDCNGRVIIHIDSDYDKPSAACPHCRSKDGVQFPQLLNATIGPEDSPVGQEVE